MLLPKIENSLEKNSFTEGFFSKASPNPVRKRKGYMTKVVIQSSAIKIKN